MFRRIIILIFAIMLTGIVLVSLVTREQNFTNDDVFCQAVFDAIKNSDEEMFSHFLLTEENVMELTGDLDEKNSEENSVKEEFRSVFYVEALNQPIISSFEKIIENAQKEKIDLAKMDYLGVFSRRTGYEVGNLKWNEIEFKLSFGEEHYSVRALILQTDKTMFVFDSLNWNKMINFKFTLVNPPENSVTISKKSSINVKIDFDAEAVNENFAWIQILVDGNITGMYSDSLMKSPFSDKVSGEALTVGTHTIEYFLQPSWNNTANNFLGKIKLDVVVD